MPNWSKMVLTKQGKESIAETQVNSRTLNLLFIGVGSGDISTEQIDMLTDLKQQEQQVNISYKEDLGNGMYKIIGSITNKDVKKGFYIRELGIYAMSESGTPFLLSIASDDSPDYLPAYGGENVVSSEFTIYVNVGSDAKCVAKFDSDIYATIRYVDGKMNEHIRDPYAHKGIFDKLKEWINSIFATKNEVNAFKSKVENDYLLKIDASNTYLTKSDASYTYTTKDYAESTYLKKNDIPTVNFSPYLKKTDASNTYLTKSDASYTYTTKDYAERTYLKKNDLPTIDFSPYLKKTDASNTYLTKSDAYYTYLTESEADRKYQPKGNYLTEYEANNAYQPKGDYITESKANSRFLWEFELKDKLLSILGVRYSIEENGYICFGPLFGGLIIQWGICKNLPYQEGNYTTVTFPVNFKSDVIIPFAIVNYRIDIRQGYNDFYLGVAYPTKENFALTLEAATGSYNTEHCAAYWIAIGR